MALKASANFMEISLKQEQRQKSTLGATSWVLVASQKSLIFFLCRMIDDVVEKRKGLASLSTLHLQLCNIFYILPNRNACASDIGNVTFAAVKIFCLPGMYNITCAEH